MESKYDHYRERRAGIERRSWHCKYDFPYVDGHGTLVTYERRDSDERRTTTNTKAPIKFHKRNVKGWVK